jgi:predicted dehydrogenase
VGFGFIAERAHLPVLFQHRPDIELKAIIDPSDARRRKAKELRPDVSVFPDLDAFFSSALSREVDFIDCCAPSTQHASIALASLRRGFHVLSEKPITLDRVSAEELRLAARSADRTLFPVHNYRFAPILREVQRRIQEGDIGQLKRIHLELHAPAHTKGVGEWDPHWRRLKKWAGGGVSVDEGVHALYLICAWFQMLPVYVQASFQGFGPGLRGWQDTEEESYIEAKFPAGGQARITLSWRSSARKIRASLVGERGSIFIDDDLFEKISVRSLTSSQVERQIIPSYWNDQSRSLWLMPVLSEFFEAISRRDSIPHQTEIALHLGAILEDFAEIRAAVAPDQVKTRPLVVRGRVDLPRLRVLQSHPVSSHGVIPQKEQQGAVS